MKVADDFKEIEIYVGKVCLKGNLRLANNSKGLVLLSYATGSSRFNVKTNYVATLLFNEGYSSLLFDLLTTQEDLVYENRFNIDLLTNRLLKITKWTRNFKHTKLLPLAFFGVSTGVASVLSTTVYLGKTVKAIITIGGRPDLAEESLQHIEAPILFIVNENDKAIIDINKRANSKIKAITNLIVIESDSHLFFEYGKLEIITKHTSNWLNKYLKE